MARSKTFKEAFVANKNDDEKLKKLFESTEAEEISQIITETAGERQGYTIWSKLIAVLEDEEKLFEVVKEVRFLRNNGTFNFISFLRSFQT